MGPKNALPFSKQTTICLNRKPDKSSPHPSKFLGCVLVDEKITGVANVLFTLSNACVI
jgi:hypothetical protein